MEKEDKIEIQISRTKNLLLLVGAVIFIVIGILLIIYPESSESSNLSTGTMRMIGGIVVAFFGLCFFFILKKLFNKNVGLRIDQYGITDNSNGASVGLIEWDDITDVYTVQIAFTNILLISTNKPEKYIEGVKNRILKMTLKANYKTYGSPISITSSTLKIKHNDLENLILKELEKRKNEENTK